MEHYLAEQACTYMDFAEACSASIASSGTTGTDTTLLNRDTTKSFLLPCGHTTTATAGRDAFARVDLTNSTTMTSTRSNAGSNNIISAAIVTQLNPLIIKSVQQGTIALSTSQTSNTATITAVDTTKSAVIFLGAINAGTGTSITSQMARVTLTNATTVTLNRNSTGSIAMTGGYVVVEFQPWAVTALQQVSNSSTSASTTDNVTVNKVDMNRAVLLYGGLTTSSTSFAATFSYLRLTSDTNVEIVRTTTTGNTRVNNFTVVEFAPGIVRSIRRGTIAVASTTSADVTVDFFNEERSWMHMLGFSTTASAFPEAFTRVRIVNETLLRAQKNTGAATTSTASYEVVWFN